MSQIYQGHISTQPEQASLSGGFNNGKDVQMVKAGVQLQMPLFLSSVVSPKISVDQLIKQSNCNAKQYT